jgi:hypothetical protein
MYYHKYLKYKQKYISFKKQLGGTYPKSDYAMDRESDYAMDLKSDSVLDYVCKFSTDPTSCFTSYSISRFSQDFSNILDDYVIGINYEGGKIINHILNSCLNCIAYANCQISMDAPFQGRVADETTRSKGPSEKNFEGYNSENFKIELKNIFEYINTKYNDIKLIIQIARGKAAPVMFEDDIKPLLLELNIRNYEVIYGYRTHEYYKCLDDEKFIFINIGMFAILSEIIPPGKILNPIKTWNILEYTNEIFIIDEKPNNWKDEKNILNDITTIKQLKLFGIADDMKFILPENYTVKSINSLIDYAKKY